MITKSPAIVTLIFLPFLLAKNIYRSLSSEQLRFVLNVNEIEFADIIYGI